MTYQVKASQLRSKDYGKVAVLMGGDDAEREVSLQSARGVVDALRKVGIETIALDLGANYLQQLQETQFDRAFIALHGGFGENGEVQAVLQAMGKPYTGSKHAASALCMDKLRSKQIFQALGINTPSHVWIRCVEDLQSLPINFCCPLAVKPNTEGSTIGVTRVNKTSQLEPAFELARRYGPDVLVEPWVEGIEFTVTVLQGQPLPSVRIVPESPYYDYDAKYLSAATQFSCPSGLDDVTERALQDLALLAFQSLGCSGWGRVDMIQDKRGQFWLLEVNTVPGLTSHSLVPIAASAVGLAYHEVVLEILATSFAQVSPTLVQEPIAAVGID